MYVLFSILLAHSYIQCTDVIWPASFYDADTCNQDQTPAHLVDPAEHTELVGEPPNFSKDPFDHVLPYYFGSFKLLG